MYSGRLASRQDGVRFHSVSHRWPQRPGKLARRVDAAEFVILSADPVKPELNRIRDIEVPETIKEDKTIFRAE